MQPPQVPQQPPTGWGQPAPAGPPAQPGRTGRAAKPRQIAPAMIVAALVMIGIAVGVVLLTRDGGGALDAEGAADGLDAVIDDADFDADGTANVRRCPLGDQQELSERVAEVLDLADDVLSGDEYNYATEDDGEFPDTVVCVADADEEDADADIVSFGATKLPDEDYDRFIEDTAGSASVELDDPEEHEGGTIYAYCVMPDEETGGRSGCGADWVSTDHDFAISLNYLTDDDDPQYARDALTELLPDLLANLADEA
jgi:hypothetical protein